MKIDIISHACLLISTEKASLVVDPWIIGSCYWRSWWNFPEPVFDVDRISKVDAVLISHIHWDHWHGPSLKRHFIGKKILIADEPGFRSEKDLRSLGFSDINRLPHGKRYSVGDINVFMYHFGLFLNDAVVVIESNGVCLVNANDAKMAGAALMQIKKLHPNIDFALRSHSSANARVCFKVESGDDFLHDDDRVHYFRSFCLFMDVLNPKYAVPFASNHCHLHDDVYSMNTYISNPIELRNYADHNREFGRSWDLKVMLPGSSWSQVRGFSCASEEAFEDLPAALRLYREQKAEVLACYRAEEEGIVISPAIYKRFLGYLKAVRIPKVHRRKFFLTVKWPTGRAQTKVIDLTDGSISDSGPVFSPEDGVPVFLIPAIIFRDAVYKKMFHHAVISKRCVFLAKNNHDMAFMYFLSSVLEGVELGRYPFSIKYYARLFFAYRRRWREVIVYILAAWLLYFKKMKIYMIEEDILRRGSR